MPWTFLTCAGQTPGPTKVSVQHSEGCSLELFSCCRVRGMGRAKAFDQLKQFTKWGSSHFWAWMLMLGIGEEVAFGGAILLAALPPNSNLLGEGK